jgi:translation initiation factor IF-1
MTRLVSMLTIVLALASAPQLLAHPGHEHTIMGTVSMVHQNHLEVKATDGKTSVITMDEKTRVLRGTAKVKTDAIKTGDRVVVTAVETKDKDGKAVVVAKEVRLAPVPQQPAPQPPKR